MTADQKPRRVRGKSRKPLRRSGLFVQTEIRALCVRVTDACVMLGIGKTMFYELVDAGEIQTIKLGRATLVTVTSLEDLVARRLGK